MEIQFYFIGMLTGAVIGSFITYSVTFLVRQRKLRSAAKSNPKQNSIQTFESAIRALEGTIQDDLRNSQSAYLLEFLARNMKDKPRPSRNNHDEDDDDDDDPPPLAGVPAKPKR